MRFFNIEPIEKPRWFEVRRRFARLLVRIAKRIYPQSPEAMSFMREVLMEQIMHGSCVVKWNDFHHPGERPGPVVSLVSPASGLLGGPPP